MRIWHQNFTDLNVFPAYRRRLQAHAAAAALPRTFEVDVHSLAPGTYPQDLAPMTATHYPYIKRRHEGQA